MFRIQIKHKRGESYWCGGERKFGACAIAKTFPTKELAQHIIDTEIQEWWDTLMYYNYLCYDVFSVRIV